MTKPQSKPKSHWLRKSFLLLIFFAAIFFSSGHFLIARDNPQLADVIVVISGGGNERIYQGINLYNSNWAPFIIVSGKAFSGYTSNAEMMRDIALEKGVPPAAIILEEEADNTYENALHVKDILSSEKIEQHKVLLVTSEYHSRRAEIVFQKVLAPLRLDIVSIPAESVDWDQWKWWRTDRGRYLTFSEIAKLVYMTITGHLEKTS